MSDTAVRINGVVKDVRFVENRLQSKREAVVIDEGSKGEVTLDRNELPAAVAEAADKKDGPE